jgi:hypothetical protein
MPPISGFRGTDTLGVAAPAPRSGPIAPFAPAVFVVGGRLLARSGPRVIDRIGAAGRVLDPDGFKTSPQGLGASAA